ncbi:carboxyltransferase domain-containing protein [Microbacterium excoecariae]|uniref:carboxyltransferase domain-containing protein n=1 Tax=Microbacterium excoecariae TaxID=2715210 RepID=UPI001408CF38|nr:carboxyltransferase domain-containing protein [Microbacterium excoecariae]
MTRPVGVRPAGERALLVECRSLGEVAAFRALLGEMSLGQIDVVPAARTVLVRFGSARAVRRAEPLLAGLDAPPVAPEPRRTVDIEVVYDGADLGVVADLAGLSPEAVVAAHQASAWVAAFGGFAPGFAYLAGGDPRLAVPRRESPRTSVPAGSVALASEFSAVYPRASPGGWRLIGRTDRALWDIERDPPALIAPGDAVRFRAVRAGARAASGTALTGPVAGPIPGRADPRPGSAIEVVHPGPLSLLEDRGRPGYAALGVTASGAADAASARQANRLVGNGADAAVIETLGGLEVRAVGDQVLSLAGAALDAYVGEDSAPSGAPFLLRGGETLRLGSPVRGLRAYLAVRGGIAAPATLGSRSNDRLSGLGPAPLGAGDALAVGAPPRGAVGAPEALASFGPAAQLRIRFGPRADAFTQAERAHLVATAWIVSAQADRVGARLVPADGARPLRAPSLDLASEGVEIGSLQVPPSGEPVLFGPDHPTTGGYPVIAVVAAADLPRAGQLRPGTRVRFVPER